MLSERIKEIKKAQNISTKELAARSKLSERTVSNILAGKDGIYLDSLVRVVDALGVSIVEIFTGTKATVGSETFTELQRQLDDLRAENETITAANKVMVAENEILQKQIDAMAAKIDLLQMQLLHKEELLAVHNYYIKKQGQ